MSKNQAAKLRMLLKIFSGFGENLAFQQSKDVYLEAIPAFRCIALLSWLIL